MACTEKHTRSMHLYGFSRILPMVHRRFFEDSKSDHGIAEEKKEVFYGPRNVTKSFQRLKELFTTTPILKVPDMDKEFLVCTDTSKEGLGGVLMQDGLVITYISRKLRNHEENYATHDLELLSIVYSLRVWRHYLIGWKFKLKTDHYGLQHIFTRSDKGIGRNYLGITIFRLLT
jgi:hypothetical protein